jgi:uncharacterized membrane protein
MPRLWIILGSIGLVLALLSGLVGGIVYLNRTWYNQGYDAATLKFERMIAAEKERQEEILKRVETSFLNDLAQQERENELLEQALRMAEEEAAKDPGRNQPALSAAGVRRLNKIR